MTTAGTEYDSVPALGIPAGPPEIDVSFLIERYWPHPVWETAKRVAWCESHYNPSAVGDHNLDPKAYGIFQIRAFPRRPTVAALLQAETNIAYAASLYAAHGWAPWANTMAKIQDGRC